MPGQVCRVGDQNAAGGVVLNGDTSVLVNGRPVAVQGSKVSPHPCCGARGCPPVHCSASTTSTNGLVLVNGVPITTLGDIDTCNHARVAGSPNVVVG
jgi:uncharacterized Zn-binding protein involved in type VI secretion